MKILMNFAVLSLAVLLTGCVSTVDGHKKMGVPLMKDSIDSRYERPLNTMIAAAKGVLGNLGKVVSHDIINNVVTGQIDNRTVWVRVIQIEPGLSAVTVQARSKGGAADVDLASEVDKQIALYLASHP